MFQKSQQTKQMKKVFFLDACNTKTVRYFFFSLKQNPIEPMQVDAPAEDNENNEEETYSIENPSIDLDFYANSYTGLAKLHRLIFIADHCPSLRLEALKMAINYVMSTYNVTLYQHLHRKVLHSIILLFE